MRLGAETRHNYACGNAIFGILDQFKLLTFLSRHFSIPQHAYKQTYDLQRYVYIRVGQKKN